MSLTQRAVQIGDSFIGDGWPIYVIAEIGINHNGSMDIARRLIEGAKRAGADAVKFQKRTPKSVCRKTSGTLNATLPGGG